MHFYWFYLIYLLVIISYNPYPERKKKQSVLRYKKKLFELSMKYSDFSGIFFSKIRGCNLHYDVYFLKNIYMLRPNFFWL